VTSRYSCGVARAVHLVHDAGAERRHDFYVPTVRPFRRVRPIIARTESVSPL
jgi:hypothetical protein